MAGMQADPLKGLNKAWPRVEWDRAKLERFKRVVEAIPLKDAIFTFEGHEFVKAYALYLIEYLDDRLPR